jgi:hypothetical protein
MSPLPERAESAEFYWTPPIHNPGDPFHMEYVLDKINDEQQRDALIANSFTTVAAIYRVLAEGAAKAAEIVAGGD